MPLFHEAGFGLPDFLGVFGDGAVAGKFAGRGDVQHRFARPALLVLVEFCQARVRLAVTLQVGQVQVVVAIGQQRIEDGLEHTRLVRLKWLLAMRSSAARVSGSLS